MDLSLHPYSAEGAVVFANADLGSAWQQLILDLFQSGSILFVHVFILNVHSFFYVKYLNTEKHFLRAWNDIYILLIFPILLNTFCSHN